MKLEQFLAKFNPAVSKKWLFGLAGVMWSGVGIMLCLYAITWLTDPLSLVTFLLGLLGVVISIAANRFQFGGLALKNIARIQALADKACLFAFQAWKGYLIIAVMVTGGMLLRSSAIPKPYLAVVYVAIGGALLQASLNYYAHLLQPAGSMVRE